MTHFASNIKISNFKSIQSLELTNCKRINLFIGRPNVGKSNILEALSLFSLPYLLFDQEANLKQLVRMEQNSELFFDGNTDCLIEIDLDSNKISLNNRNEISTSHNSKEIQDFTIHYDSIFHIYKIEFLEKNKSKFQNTPHYKTYFFPKQIKFEKNRLPFLSPPDGKNLFDVIQSHKELKDEFINLFKTYGLHLVFDKSSQELKVMKGVEKGEIFLIPFNSIADSLQRLIFYKTAIKSNKNSVITFEEPEAHTYPPYIAQIARDMIEATDNQFFITTHSPYVVNEFLENAQQELCIFLVDFKDGQTVAKRLTEAELDEVYNDGIDLFFNNEFFS